jgi:hypothetical protein
MVGDLYAKHAGLAHEISSRSKQEDVMNRKTVVVSLVVVLTLLIGTSQATGKQAGTTSVVTPYSFAFTYQGQLRDANGLVSGTCDLKFGLWDAASEGSQVGNLLEISGVQLEEGLFTARLDFGAQAHTGGARWLDVAVRCPAGSGGYETLKPRQELTAAPAALSLALPFRALADNNGPLIFAQNSNTSGTLSTGIFGSGYVGLTGSSSSVGGMGVRGSANPDSGVAYGVYGESSSPSGFGVYGQATAESGATLGVSGYSSSISGTGVYGWAGASSGETYGVHGKSSSDSGTGVYGVGRTGVEGTSGFDFGVGVQGNATAESGLSVGVYGENLSTNGTGVFGWAKADSGETVGVAGTTSSTSGKGVYGNATASSGETYGVYGESSSNGGAGVYGSGITGVEGSSDIYFGVGVFGDASGDHGRGILGNGYYGVVGSSSSELGRGVSGLANARLGIGVYGEATITTSAGVGVEGRSKSPWGKGVFGWAVADTGDTAGVVGYSSSTSGKGVYGKVTAGSGHTTGVYGESESTSGRGVVGETTAESGNTFGVIGYSASPDGYAGFFRNTSSGVGLAVQTDSGTGNIIEARSSFSEVKFRVARDGNVYADGTFIPGGADYAELLSASAGLQPGDVLVIGANGKLTRSTSPAQTSVVGVYSTQPGFLAGANKDGAVSEDQVPLAVMGVVPVKVTAENGPIQPGDLLTTSSVPGHAMRAWTDPLPGTVIGKALEAWESGSGVIQMLVMLR